MTDLFHPHLASLLGIIALGIWLHLFLGRGWFWRIRRADADREAIEALHNWPSVVAVVPARNEAPTIGRLVLGMLRQDYPGPFSIVIVDDHSEDETGNIVRLMAAENGVADRVRIANASALPPGWTGKLWALNEGLTNLESAGSATALPTYYWFTDADVTHGPDTLRRLVAKADSNKLDLASLMVLLNAKTLPEQALIPAFLYFFLMLYPPRWTADDDLALAGAAGGCILLKREALTRIGGFAAIRGEVIDDCSLAKAVKSSGGKVWMGLTRKSESLRAYNSFSEIRDLIARTAFTQLRYSALLLAATLAGMLLTYIAPIVLLFARDSTARLLGLTAWFLMSASFFPTLRYYRLSPLWAPLLPLAALFYTYATWLSAFRYWMGRGGLWKGRAQAPKQT